MNFITLLATLANNTISKAFNFVTPDDFWAVALVQLASGEIHVGIQHELLDEIGGGGSLILAICAQGLLITTSLPHNAEELFTDLSVIATLPIDHAPICDGDLTQKHVGMSVFPGQYCFTDVLLCEKNDFYHGAYQKFLLIPPTINNVSVTALASRK